MIVKCVAFIVQPSIQTSGSTLEFQTVMAGLLAKYMNDKVHLKSLHLKHGVHVWEELHQDFRQVIFKFIALTLTDLHLNLFCELS